MYESENKTIEKKKACTLLVTFVDSIGDIKAAVGNFGVNVCK